MKIKYLFLILTTLTMFTAKAQTNPVYNIMVERGWAPLAGENKTGLTHDEMDKEFLLSMGYNDTTVSNLKTIGVDLSSLRTMYSHLNEKVFTALSDCIIIGVVKRKEYPMKENASFNTIAYIEVNEFLRNDYNLSKGEVPVVIRSGPTASKLILEVEGEDTLRIGENVLLFLSAAGIINEAKINKGYELYNQLINAPTIKFKIIAKYELENENVIVRNEIKRISSLKDNINAVLNVIIKSKPSVKN